jgi:hypothetical protein
VVATIASVALVVAWLVIDGGLWDHPDDDSRQARERSRLYNASTLVTVGGGLGSGLESDEAIRAAAYSKREQDRRERLAHDRSTKRSAP